MSADRLAKLSSVSADLLEADTRRPRIIVYSIVAALSTALAWSCLTTVLEVSSGQGRVIPERRLQVVQSFEGGVIQQLLSRPGDRVKKGDTIALLDPVYSRSELGEITEQVAGLEASAVRLRAELAVMGGDSQGSGEQLARLDPALLDTGSGEPGLGPASDAIVAAAERYRLEFSERFAAEHDALIRQSTEQFRTEMRQLGNALSVFEQQILQKRNERKETEARLNSALVTLKLAQEDHAALRKLLKSGAASRAEVSSAQARMNDVQGAVEQLRLSLPRFDAAVRELQDRLRERLSNAQADAAGRLNEIEVKKSALAETAVALKQRTLNTAIRAPVTGVLKTLTPTTEGQVIKAGESIAEIVPTDSSLLIQVRVRPDDIAFIEAGMSAQIKLTAYDFSLFGALSGIVEQVAGDSTTDDKGSTYYLVDVRAAANHLERHGVNWPVKAGMVATVDIVTGKQTIFQYVTKPIHRMALSALRER